MISAHSLNRSASASVDSDHPLQYLTFALSFGAGLGRTCSDVDVRKLSFCTCTWCKKRRAHVMEAEAKPEGILSSSGAEGDQKPSSEVEGSQYPVPTLSSPEAEEDQEPTPSSLGATENQEPTPSSLGTTEDQEPTLSSLEAEEDQDPRPKPPRNEHGVRMWPGSLQILACVIKLGWLPPVSAVLVAMTGVTICDHPIARDFPVTVDFTSLRTCVFRGLSRKLCSANMTLTQCVRSFRTPAYSGLCDFCKAPPAGSSCR